MEIVKENQEEQGAIIAQTEDEKARLQQEQFEHFLKARAEKYRIAKETKMVNTNEELDNSLRRIEGLLKVLTATVPVISNMVYEKERDHNGRLTANERPIIKSTVNVSLTGQYTEARNYWMERLIEETDKL
jgi:hypothetical protein